MEARGSEFNRVGHVTIVGGGTAGWLAAAMLNSSLNEHSDAPRVRVTLIESPNVPTVGVGEATVPGMPRLLGQLGLDEKQFFLRCNASFKLGVRFVDWHLDAAGRSLEFFHPFDSVDTIHGMDPSYHFHRFVGPGQSRDFFDHLLPSGDVIRACKGPRRVEDHRGRGMCKHRRERRPQPQRRIENRTDPAQAQGRPHRSNDGAALDVDADPIEHLRVAATERPGDERAE